MDPRFIVTDYRFIQGWFDYQYVFDKYIEFLSKKLKRKVKVVEIGAWLGRSSFYLVGHHADKADIYIVDTWFGSSNELETNHKRVLNSDIFIDFMRNMQVHHGKFIPLRCLSIDAAKIFQNNSIDFVFIDGEHTYEAVKADIKTWSPKLTEFGIIAGHDYHYSWPGVMEAVNEVIGIDNINVEGVSWVRKPILL